MPLHPDPTIATARPDRRMAAAWARLGVGAVAVLVPVSIVLGSVHAAHAAGVTAVHTALGSVSAALTAQHDADGGWPADLLVVGGTVVDDAGRPVAAIPDGVALTYVRSPDGSHAVVTFSDRGAQAVFDSARTAG